MSTINVRLGPRSYPILIEQTYARLESALRRLGLGPDVAVVTNRRVLQHVGREVVRRLRRDGWDCQTLLVPDTERAKSAAWAFRLTGELARRFRGRVPTVLAVGGGVVGDTAGFVASIFRRGVPYVQVPTTLLAQVDSAIGGKVAIDLPEGKNLAGSFYQPRAVFSNVSVLSTLSARQLRSGLGEVMKYGVMADAQLFAYLERHAAAAVRADAVVLRLLVERCSRIKARLVSADEHEQHGRRTLLNFGHTIGHAIEAAGGYSHRYLHGEAVAVGMLVAGSIAATLGYWRATDAQRLKQLIQCLGLPTDTRGVTAARILAATRYDKKHLDGRTRWVLPTRIGQAVVVTDVPEAVVRRALQPHVKGT